MATWLTELRPNARSLNELYRTGVPRRQIYEEMVEAIMTAVRSGSHSCAVFYGHPGVVVNPSHEAVRRARAEGYPARMLPAISAEDCLIADLGVDPGRGWQSYEATALLLYGYRIEPTAALVVWQVDAIGKLDWNLEPEPRGLHKLAEHLLGLYPADHQVTFYNASIYPVGGPMIERVRLASIPSLASAPCPTLYVPPLPRRPIDREAAAELGITPS
jgi:hypothetical protein